MTIEMSKFFLLNGLHIYPGVSSGGVLRVP